MNEPTSITSTAQSNRPPASVPPLLRRSATIKVSFSMERGQYDEITSTLAQITDELGLELTLPKFLKKTVTEGWKLQAERYRKLNTSLKR